MTTRGRTRSGPRITSACLCLLVRRLVRRSTLCEGGSTLCEGGCERRNVHVRTRCTGENEDHKNRQARGAKTTHEADIVYAGDHGAASVLSSSLTDLRRAARDSATPPLSAG